MLKFHYFGHLKQRTDSLDKNLMLGKIAGKRRRGREMMRWLDDINGHKSEQTPGDSEGQGSQACCSSWGHRESDATEPLNNNSALTKTI